METPTITNADRKAAEDIYMEIFTDLSLTSFEQVAAPIIALHMQAEREAAGKIAVALEEAITELNRTGHAPDCSQDNWCSLCELIFRLRKAIKP